MTLEEKPSHKDEEHHDKHGPSAVRDSSYSREDQDTPSRATKSRRNREDIEKIHVDYSPRLSHRGSLSRSFDDGDGTLDSHRPDWKYWPKYNDNRMPKPYDDDPVFGQNAMKTLPPINLGWKAEPMVGSLSNIHHQPGGGDRPIFNEKIKWKTRSKIASLENIDYRARMKKWVLATSPRPSKGRRYYTTGGPDVILTNYKFERVSPRVGSLENLGHTPRGGDVTIPNQHLSWKAKSKVGSLDNINHQPEGGDIYIINQTVEWKAKPRVGSLDNIHHQPRTTIGRIPNIRQTWDGRPRIGSLDNINHNPGGGNVVIPSHKLHWHAEHKSHFCHRDQEEDWSLM